MAGLRKAAAGLEPDDRGEVTLRLDGQEYHLRPSWQAIRTCEKETGRSLFELTNIARANGLSLTEMAVITAEMMHAYGRSHPDDPLVTDHLGAKPDRLEELIFEAGALSIQPRLTILLLAALTGGVDAQGDWKAVTGKKAEAPVTAD
jgi:hypothetical protein